MKKEIIKKDKQNNVISRILGIILLIALLCMPKSIAWAASNGAANAPYQSYALHVATGLADGSGIGFFAIEYKDTSGKLHRQYIFPHDGDYKKGFDKVLKDSNL